MIRFEFLFVVVSAILTLLFPLLGIPINLFGVVFVKKTRKVSAFLLALSFALIAYAWNPPDAADLSRHHSEMALIGDYNIVQLFEYASREFNFVQIFTESIVSKTGDYDLLQLLIVTVGLFEMFWIICDYATKKNIKSYAVGAAILLAIMTFRFVDFASGLWFALAIINLSLGIYLRYFHYTKKLHFLFYAVSVLCHVSVLYMIAILVLMRFIKAFRNASWYSLVIVFVVFSAVGVIINYLVTNFDSQLFVVLQHMYQSYFEQEKYSKLILDWNFYAAILGIVFSIIVSIVFRGKEKNSYTSLVLIGSIATLALMFQSRVFTRFSLLLVLLSLIPFMDIITSKLYERKKLLVGICFIVLLSVNTYRNIEQLIEYNVIDDAAKSGIFIEKQ